MDYVNPQDLMRDAIVAAENKSSLAIGDMVLRGALAGVLLGFATSLAVMVTAQGLPPIAGAILFPVGFVMLVLLGLELATGNFALLPAAWAAGGVSPKRLLRNWGWVYLGNLMGSVFYAFLFYLALTNFGTSGAGKIGDLLKMAAQNKTLAYMALGSRGWGTALVKGVLCNWMVTIAVLLALASRSTVGKVVAMWLPIMTFFAQGFEHSVVNMFVIPVGMMFGAPVSIAQWLAWNQLPVTLGNILSGALFTGLALQVTYRGKETARVPAPERARSRPAETKVAFLEASGSTP
jgi:formate/nitrite transporter